MKKYTASKFKRMVLTEEDLVNINLGKNRISIKGARFTFDSCLNCLFEIHLKNE